VHLLVKKKEISTIIKMHGTTIKKYLITYKIPLTWGIPKSVCLQIKYPSGTIN